MKLVGYLLHNSSGAFCAWIKVPSNDLNRIGRTNYYISVCHANRE